jgi:hypothetical protein
MQTNMQNENNNTGKVFVLASQRRPRNENFALFVSKYNRLTYFQQFGLGNIKEFLFSSSKH